MTIKKKALFVLKFLVSAIPFYISLYLFSYLLGLSKKTFGDILGNQIILIIFSLLITLYIYVYLGGKK